MPRERLPDERPTPPVAPERHHDALSIGRLRSFGTAPALHTESGTLSYDQLCDRVEARIGRLGSGRRVVALAGDNSVETVVTLLACLEARHVALLLDPGADRRPIVERFEPETTVDVTATTDPDIDHVVDPAVIVDATRLHPDLALLLSTSGSTGTPKLVRLARDGIVANAESIADYLRLTPSDRGITSLPLHYCYGLSVVTSHLAAGASVVLTDTSVVDPCFADAIDRWAVTGVAGVPYSFEMMERRGFRPLDRPSIRYVTQAGGRLDPDRVLRVAEFGRAQGWELFVMYGQTEATARMAYLPPEAVFEHPGAVGRAIPGGSIRLDRTGLDDGVWPDDAGEVVYRGPNVMMGYATERADLAAGRELDELRTGDVGRISTDGHLELIGRTSRFIKIYGKRIDLEEVGRRLSVDHGAVTAAGDDELLVVAVDRPGSAGPAPSLRADAAALTGLPEHRVAAVALDRLPRTASGKLDGAALTDTARSVAPDSSDGRTPPTVAALFAEMLGVATVAPSASFASLGGDSLSYVETSLRLEAMLGELPPHWHLMSVADLEARAGETGPRGLRLTARVDTSVVVRAIAIALIVCTHMKVFRLAGGAHALVAVIGFNFARFQLPVSDLPGRVRRGLGTVARVAVPTSIWIGINMAIAGGYSVGSLFLLNNYFGSAHRTDGRWQYWYFEAFVQLTLLLVVIFSIRTVRRTERRAPILFALGAVALTIPIRFEWVSFGDPYNEIFRPHTVACFLAVGWLAAVVRTTPARLLATAITAVVTFGYFESVGRTDQFDRELRIFLLIAVLVWLPTIRLPRPAAAIVGWVAAASMWIFLVHWQVFPLLTPRMDDRAAWFWTMAIGVAVWFVVDRLALRRMSSWWATRESGRARRETFHGSNDAILALRG